MPNRNAAASQWREDNPGAVVPVIGPAYLRDGEGALAGFVVFSEQRPADYLFVRGEAAGPLAGFWHMTIDPEDDDVARHLTIAGFIRLMEA